MKIRKSQLRQIIREELLLEGKSYVTLYHIGNRPARPRPARPHRPGSKGSGWERPWLDEPVEVGVFLTDRPHAVGLRHGVWGNVYAYRVSKKFIQAAGGLHKFDRAREIIFSDDLWTLGLKTGGIKFLGKSLDADQFSHEVEAAARTMSVAPYERADEKTPKVPDPSRLSQIGYLRGLLSSKDPSTSIKLMTPDEARDLVKNIDDEIVRLAGPPSAWRWPSTYKELEDIRDLILRHHPDI